MNIPMLPTDLIIQILVERKNMKQGDRFKNNFKYCLKEILKVDKAIYKNLVKTFYESKRKNTAKLMLLYIRNKKLVTKNRIQNNIDYLTDGIYSWHHDTSVCCHFKTYIIKHFDPNVFVESSDEDMDVYDY